MEGRKSSAGWLLAVIVTILVLSGAWLYTNWRSSQTVLPPGLTINGLPMAGMTRQQALNTIVQAYTVPVTVTYAGEVISPLLPEMVELNVDLERTAANLDEVVLERSGWRDFLHYVAGRFVGQEGESYPVNAVVNYSRERVDAFLERMAQKYDHPPQPPVLLPEASTFRPARGGTELDMGASLPLLINALLAADPARRQIDLIVKTEPAPATAVEILAEALTISLEEVGGIAGVFAKDLGTGQELCINCQVAFSGLSTLKPAIALEGVRVAPAPHDTEMAALLEAVLTEDDNTAANALLARIGATNPYSGALQVTDLLWDLGLESSFLAAPYDLETEVPPPVFTTPANAAGGPGTEDDTYRQTTAREMGLLLEGLYQCARDGGMLRLLYPGEISPAECAELLAGMERNQVNPVLASGLAEGTRVAYQQGWVGSTHAVVAVIYGRQTDVVLTAYLYQPAWLIWEESVPTFTKIAQLVDRFFSGDLPRAE